MVRDRRAPEDMPTVAIGAGTVHLPALLADRLGVASRSEARRLIAGGGVSLDGEPVTELDVASERPRRARDPGRQAAFRPAAAGGRSRLTGASGGPPIALTRGDPAVYSLDPSGGVCLPVGQETRLRPHLFDLQPMETPA